jgi:hypothetical protein
MIQSVIAVGLAPLLAGFSTLAARRWGPLVGGTVSAFPAIVGPTLLIVALDHGPAFAARAANGTLLGLVALSAFAVAYGHAALRGAWPRSLVAGWIAAGTSASCVGALVPSSRSPVGLVIASVSLLSAFVALPLARVAGGHAGAGRALGDSRSPVVVRMVATAVLVSALSAASSALGPLVGGMLAGLPVLASVIAVFTHRDGGPDALLGFLRGVLAGMAGFVAFCQVLAVMLVGYGVAPAFLTATAAAVVVQSVIAARCVRVRLAGSHTGT